MWKIALVGVVLIACGETINEHHISKRYLLFPRATIFQFTYGLTVPVVLPRRSINLSFCFQAQYNEPYNVSNFVPKVVAVRANKNKFDLSRITFYKYFAGFLENIGLKGEECVLRTVCEIAEIPMFENNKSLLEDISTYVFTPSIGIDVDTFNRTLQDDSLEFSQKLVLAEKYGKESGNCGKMFSDCIASVLDVFTELYAVR